MVKSACACHRERAAYDRCPIAKLTKLEGYLGDADLASLRYPRPSLPTTDHFFGIIEKNAEGKETFVRTNVVPLVETKNMDALSDSRAMWRR